MPSTWELSISYQRKAVFYYQETQPQDGFRKPGHCDCPFSKTPCGIFSPIALQSQRTIYQLCRPFTYYLSGTARRRMRMRSAMITGYYCFFFSFDAYHIRWLGGIVAGMERNGVEVSLIRSKWYEFDATNVISDCFFIAIYQGLVKCNLFR